MLHFALDEKPGHVAPSWKNIVNGVSEPAKAPKNTQKAIFHTLQSTKAGVLWGPFFFLEIWQISVAIAVHCVSHCFASHPKNLPGT